MPALNGLLAKFIEKIKTKFVEKRVLQKSAAVAGKIACAIEALFIISRPAEVRMKMKCFFGRIGYNIRHSHAICVRKKHFFPKSEPITEARISQLRTC